MNKDIDSINNNSNGDLIQKVDISDNKKETIK